MERYLFDKGDRFAQDQPLFVLDLQHYIESAEGCWCHRKSQVLRAGAFCKGPHFDRPALLREAVWSGGSR